MVHLKSELIELIFDFVPMEFYGEEGGKSGAATVYPSHIQLPGNYLFPFFNWRSKPNGSKVIVAALNRLRLDEFDCYYLVTVLVILFTSVITFSVDGFSLTSQLSTCSV